MMKTTKYLLTIIFLMLMSVSQAQEKFKISAYSGANETEGDFKELTKSGFDLGITFDYAISKKFKLGFDVNHQINDFINPVDFGKIPESDSYSIANIENGNWKIITIGFGPTYTFGNYKFFVDLYSKAGISLTQSPTALTTIDFNGIESELFRLDNQKVASFGITSGLRFNYSLSNNLSIFINPQYVYSSAKVKYNFRDINPSFIDDEFNPGLLVEQPLEVKEVNPSYLNLNLGLTLKLGAKKNKLETEEENELDQSCLKTILQSPNNNESYLLNSKVQPVFTWFNHSNAIKGYEFILFDNDKVIFSKKTKSNTLKIDKKLKRILSNQTVKEKIFEWQVKTAFENCPDQYSEKQSLSIRASNTIEINITDIECLTPAYDANGNVRYKAKVEFKTGNNSSQWNINSLSLIESGQTIPISNLNSCTSQYAISPFPPLVLTPNSSSIWCFEFSVPIGSLNQTFQANGSLGNGSGDVSVLKNLPSCICNVCDKWQIIPSNENFWKFNFNGGLSNMRLRTDFQILNSDPIQKVKAEIVSVQHKVNDTLCYSCTKDDNTMGLFHKSNSSGLIISRNGWQDNGVGTLYDENNDNYGNVFTWKATTSQGVDFSTKKMFLMNMNLPPLSSLNCCETTYKVCVRYTFEDINCQTCDYLVCYEFNSSTTTSTGGGIGTGVGTGTGNQSGGVLTPIQIKTKN